MDTSQYLGLFVDESGESLQTLTACLLALERAPADPEPLAELFRIAHSLKGMSAAMGVDAMARLTHRMEEVLAAMRDGDAAVTPAVSDALFACIDRLQEMVDRVAAGDPGEVDASAVLARLDAVAPGPAASPATAELAATLAPVPPGAGGAGPIAAPGAPGRSPATVRVATERLDALASLVGRMVIHQTRLARIADERGLEDLRGAVEEMSRVTDELRTLLVQVRRMPVDAVFARFPRMVRDLANTLGKRLELVVTGGETELDRTIIDRLGEPLVHVLRNAVDHGLESPSERAAAGKEPVGRVYLSARQDGDHVVIEVRDDGRGIDPAAMRASVVRKGLMDAPAAAALSDERALEVVFLPGFSTAARATDISGRGVGMDAVRAAVAELDGEVSIWSAPGRGSAVTVRIPLAPATVPALLVTSAATEGGTSRVYAVPLAAIEETVVVDRHCTRLVGGRACMVRRGAAVPLVRAGDWRGLEAGGDGDGARHDRLDVLVVAVGSARMGLVVDRLVGTQDVPVAHLPDRRDEAPGVAGTTILGDGSIARIVDVAAAAALAGIVA